MSNLQKNESKIEIIQRDSRGMFVSGDVKKSYSVEALTKGLDRVKNHQSVDSLNLLELFDSSNDVSADSVIPRTSSNIVIDSIPEDSGITNKVRTVENMVEPSNQSLLSLASEPQSEGHLSAREVRRQRSASMQQSESEFGEYKYNSTDSFVSNIKSALSSSLPPTVPLSNRASNPRMAVNEKEPTNMKDVERKLSQLAGTKDSDLSIASTRDMIDSESVRSVKSSGRGTKKPPLPKPSRVSRSNSFTSMNSNPMLLNDSDEEDEAIRVDSIPVPPKPTALELQHPQTPPRSSLVERKQAVEEKPQPKVNPKPDIPVEKSHSMNRLNIPSPLKIAVSNVDKPTRSNSADIEPIQQKRSKKSSSTSLTNYNSDSKIESTVSNTEEISKKKSSGRSSKKRSKKYDTDEEIKVSSEKISSSELRKMERKLSAVTDDQVLTEEELKAIKKEKKKKKKEQLAEKSPEIPIEPPNVAEKANTTATDPVARLYESLGHPPEYYQNSTIKVYIHKSDTLKPDIHLKHPLVKIHIVDTSTGLYLEKSDQMRQVTFFHEPENINFILPTITNPFNLLQNHTKDANWDQKILLNESYLHLLQPNVIVFFEILDFLTNYSQIKKSNDSWLRVAWAFLKPIGGNGKATTEKEARLQLYKYPRHLKPFKDSKAPFVYSCWKENWKRYPSTLYVTLSAHGVIKKPPPKVYDIDLQVKSPEKSLLELRSPLIGHHTPVWNRKLDEPCSLPNKLMYRIETGTKGSFSCKFSNNGLYISVGCCNQNGYPIKIYQFETGDRIATLDGHQDLVYQQQWSEDDSELLTCSSDGTARVWGFMSDGSVMLTNTLVHPCFVYTASFYPGNASIIATGGYDGYIRLWLHQKRVKTMTTKPMLKLLGHETHINTLCFNKEGTRMYSGDGNGNVRIWASINQDHNLSFECIKTVDTLKGFSIQSLQVHVSNRKLLVQTHGSLLHMLDTRIHRYLTHYTLPGSPWHIDSSITDLKEHVSQAMTQFTKCSFSACGTFVFSSNSMGQVHVWMSDSGSFVNTYSIDTISSWIHSLPIVDIQFHPCDNSIAFSVWGDKQPFLIYRHSPSGPDLKTDEKHGNYRHLDVEKIVTKSMNLLHLAS